MATDTKEQILDTSERLFAERGIDAVSLRMITAEAGVNLAAVHYHFGSKEALVKEVFARRVGSINRDRVTLLDECESRAGDGPLSVEEVLESFIGPAIRLCRDPERGPMFMRLCGRFYIESAAYMENIFDELFDEVVKRYTAAFRRALPELPPVEMFWRVSFAVGAMIHTMQDAERLKRLSGGLCDPSDAEAVIRRLVQFGATGLRAPFEPAEQPATVASGAREGA